MGGGGGGLLPHCPSHLTHSPCVRMSLSLSLPHALTPRPAAPSPSLPWERVHLAGLRRERPEVPVWGKKKGWGVEQYLLGASQELCEAPSLTLSLQPHPVPRTAHPSTTLSPLHTHTLLPTRLCQLAQHPLSVPTPSSTSPPSPHAAPTPSESCSFISPGPCSSFLLPSPAFHGKGLLAQARENWQEACLCKDTLTF